MKFPLLSGLSEQTKLYAWLGVLVVVVVAAGLFIFDPSLHAAVLPAATTTSGTNLNTTYTSGEFGFNFSYPQIWTISNATVPQFGGAELGVVFNGGSVSGLAGGVINNYSAGVYADSSPTLAQFVNSFFGSINNGPTNITQTTINGLPAVKFSMLNPNITTPFRWGATGVIAFKNGSTVVVFASPTVKGSSAAQAETNTLTDVNLNLLASEFSFSTAPTVSITASPDVTAGIGSPVSVSWTSTGDYVKLDSHYVDSTQSLGAISPAAVNGSRLYYPIGETYYTAQACTFSGLCGNVQQIEVTVMPQVKTLSATPSAVTTAGASTTVSWSCSNCSFATITGASQGTTTVSQNSGTFTVPITQNTTFTVTPCVMSNVHVCGTAQSLTVNLLSGWSSYTSSALGANPNSVNKFTLDYPSTWNAEPNGTPTAAYPLSMNFSTPTSLSTSTDIGLNVTVGTDTLSSTISTAESRYSAMANFSETTLSFAGQAATEIIYMDSSGNKHKTIYFSDNGLTYAIAGINSEPVKQVTDQFDLITSSFQIVNQ